MFIFGMQINMTCTIHVRTVYLTHGATTIVVGSLLTCRDSQ